MTPAFEREFIKKNILIKTVPVQSRIYFLLLQLDTNSLEFKFPYILSKFPFDRGTNNQSSPQPSLVRTQDLSLPMVLIEYKQGAGHNVRQDVRN